MKTEPALPTTVDELWDVILREALTCPLLYQMVTAAKLTGDRERVLMQAVLWLSKDRREWMRKEVERLNRQVPAPIVYDR